jgi:uncharacterized SAM-binding protein YcdF (DUF218 family)
MSYIEPLIGLFLAISAVAWVRVEGTRVKRLLALGLGGLFLVTWPPAAWFFSRPLEFPFPVEPPHLPPHLESIVVLGGGITPPDYERPYPAADLDTMEHCAIAAWVSKKAGRVPVLACEGSHGDVDFMSAMRPLLEGGGVPADLIWIEDRSRSTHENAVYGSQILRAHGLHRIALVTDAQSMRRAMACFRKEGMIVTPVPCDFTQLNVTFKDLIPNWKALRRNEKTLHEGLGLLWYALRGWL